MNETNQRLVASVAKLFEDQGLSHEELIAAGNRGLRKAEEHYMPNTRFRFIAYAVWWIRQCILDALTNYKSEKIIKIYLYMNILDTIRKKTKNNGIKLPEGISFELKNQTLFISVSSKGVVSNMQKDNSAFEGWCVCLKALLPNIIQNVVLDWVLPLPNSNQTEMIHYNRFLFRAILFDKYFDWVSIASLRKDELSAFEKAHDNLVVNYPKSDSKQQVAQNGTINKGEAILERKICSNMQKRGLIANHQLPVGLFDFYIHKNNTCTPRSASQIDLWSLDKNALNVYELKDEDNNAVGIITELMFYANVMNMIRKHKINYPDEVEKLRNPKRNIQDLYHAIIQNQILKVNAILLTYKLHPLIDCNKDEVLKLINRSMEPEGISFSHELVQDYLEEQ